MAINDVSEALVRHRRFLLTSHYNPDGDNIASQLALASILKSLNKQVAIVNQDPVPGRYRFLPGWESIKNEIVPQNASCAVVLDCANIDRIGKAADIITPATMEIINIDHHVSNNLYGHFHYVDSEASSTCELVFRLAQKLRVKPTPEQAQIILTGMMADTGGFRYSSTSADTLRAAGLLSDYGAKIGDVAEQLYYQQPLNQLKILGELLSRLKTGAKGRLAYMALTQDLIKKYQFDLSESEEFVKYALAVKGAEVAILFKEQGNGIIRVSFRAKGRVDVNQLASKFGGGGHVSAAGARLNTRLDDAVQKVVQMAEAELN
ncbi:bifunctional oligoribonuclease/PAP phosphatase NrnA [candidate division TA06 bacterium]|uniref:Bifunctional oligoribonuclease/PAP phosphatase NrnA n=1 Tax=candidate division TA06 bacterium TaxID=2250710 RepID=A0A933ID13_UNCT6|nr:bifunctional oligoribonuclease/PAP phosphatase NrnA [candidate division TA06 bacterium]